MFFKQRSRVRAAALTGMFFLLNLILDRLTKILALEFLEGKPPVSFLDGMVVFIYAENTGAFLSLGSNWGQALKWAVFIVIPAAVCLFGLWYIIRREQKWYRIVSFSCIIGGGAGNLIDRIANDFRVIDFMNFGIGSLRTGILNVADLSVTFGVIALLICEYRSHKNGIAVP